MQDFLGGPHLVPAPGETDRRFQLVAGALDGGITTLQPVIVFKPPGASEWKG